MAKAKAAAKAKSKSTKPAKPARPAKAAKPAKATKKTSVDKPAAKPDGAAKAAAAKRPDARTEGAPKPAAPKATQAATAKTVVADASAVVAGTVPITRGRPNQSSPAAFAKTVAAPAAVDDTGLTWMDAGNGYQVALDGTKLVARNAAGKRLSSVPKEVKSSELVDEIESMRDWLVEHDRECIATVEQWMLRSLPVPRAVLQAVWDDPSWRRPLENAVVVALDERGSYDFARAGLFRGADGKKGIGIVDLDGETGWLDVEQVAVPHPILVAELDAWRDLVTQLGVTQGIAQLHRETYARPRGITAGAIDQFENGKFAMLVHALGKARALGYKVRGGFATCKVLERGAVCEARYWIGADSPEAETFTGQLSWVDHRERGLELAAVGPVAFSEGMRMASAIYAARVVEKTEEAA